MPKFCNVHCNVQKWKIEYAKRKDFSIFNLELSKKYGNSVRNGLDAPSGKIKTDSDFHNFLRDSQKPEDHTFSVRVWA